MIKVSDSVPGIRYKAGVNSYLEVLDAESRQYSAELELARARRDLLLAHVDLYRALGGFITFSAFGLETVHLLKRGEMMTAAVYVLASVLGGIAAILLVYRFTA